MQQFLKHLVFFDFSITSKRIFLFLEKLEPTGTVFCFFCYLKLFNQSWLHLKLPIFKILASSLAVSQKKLCNTFKKLQNLIKFTYLKLMSCGVNILVSNHFNPF